MSSSMVWGRGVKELDRNEACLHNFLPSSFTLQGSSYRESKPLLSARENKNCLSHPVPSLLSPSGLGLPSTLRTSALVGLWPSARRMSPHCP